MSENYSEQNSLSVKSKQSSKLVSPRPLLVFIAILILGVISYFIYQAFFSPKARALRELDTIVKTVESPDKNLIKRYGITSDKLKSNTQQILNGALDKNIPGLYNVRDSIDKNNMSLARKQLLDVFDNWLWGRLIPIGPGKIAAVVLTDEEKKQADPNNEIFGRNPQKAPAFSPIRRNVAITILHLFYRLKNGEFN